MKNYKIAVAGTGYVGLSLSVLLAQHNQVMAVDIVQAKVDMMKKHAFLLQVHNNKSQLIKLLDYLDYPDRSGVQMNELRSLIYSERSSQIS